MVYESVISVFDLSRNIAQRRSAKKMNGTAFLADAYPSLLSVTKFTEFVERAKALLRWRARDLSIIGLLT
jgi:hypothetical protein